MNFTPDIETKLSTLDPEKQKFFRTIMGGPVGLIVLALRGDGTGYDVRSFSLIPEGTKGGFPGELDMLEKATVGAFELLGNMNPEDLMAIADLEADGEADEAAGEELAALFQSAKPGKLVH